MLKIRVVEDLGELVKLVQQFAEVRAASAPAAGRAEFQAGREATYRSALADPELRGQTAAVAETPNGRVVAFKLGGRYVGASSPWRESGGGALVIPQGGATREVSHAVREQWAERPVPHCVLVAVHPEFKRQGLGTAVTRAWGEARPADETYATGHIAFDNASSLAMFHRLGAQIVGAREYGQYLYLLPLRGQSRARVSAQVTTIQGAAPPGVDAALCGLGPVREIGGRQPGARTSAIPMEGAIQRAAAMEQGRER